MIMNNPVDMPDETLEQISSKCFAGIFYETCFVELFYVIEYI